MAQNLPLCVWWLAENSLVHCFTFDFLLSAARTGGRRHLPVWLAVNGAAALAVMFFRPPAAFALSVLFLGVFARLVLKVPGSSLIVPLAAIITLCTLKEGFSALLLSWLSVSVSSSTGGIAEQLLVPLLLDALLFAALRVVGKRCPPAAPPYLRVFLPVCAFAVVSIRWGLRLDFPDFEPYLAAFSINDRLSALYLMLGAAAVMFTLFGTFCSLACLSDAKKLLQRQLAEAIGRNRSYAAFQHDIDNHLLVISGLLRAKSFAQAERYANQLRRSSCPPLDSVPTGSPALDVLLREKLSIAARGHIAAAHDVSLGSFAAEDMDLCALFANILDNAIAACLKEPEHSRFLSLTAKVRSQFLVIEAVNGTSASGPIVFGTGLRSIRRIAEAYQGTMEAALDDGRFRISVLLCSR